MKKDGGGLLKFFTSGREGGHQDLTPPAGGGAMSKLDEIFASADEDLRMSRLFFSAQKDEYCSEGIIGTLPGIINYAIQTLTWVPYITVRG